MDAPNLGDSLALDMVEVILNLDKYPPTPKDSKIHEAEVH